MKAETGGIAWQGLALALVAAIAAGGCADVRTRPSTFVPSAAADPQRSTLTLAAPLEVSMAGADDLALPSGTVLESVGQVAEGAVYRPRGRVITVQRINVHEAYPVVAGGTLVGVYLPVEKAYVAAAEPVALPVPEVSPP